MPQHRGDNGRFETPSDKADGLAGHGNPAMMVGDRLGHREEAAAIVHAAEVRWGGRKGELRVGPGEEAEGFETAEGGPQIFSSHSTNESVEFTWCVIRELARVDLASPRDHLMRRKPDTEIHESDAPGAVDPPEETELLDR